MRKLKLLIALIIIATSSWAQEGQFYQFVLKHETKVKGSKIFIKDLVNKGKENQIDVNSIFKKETDYYFSTFSGNKEKKIQNHISWTKDSPIFTRASSEAEADVVVGGFFTLTTKVDLEEKLLYERQANVGGAIPYYEIRQTNNTYLQLIISYTYKDKSVDYDTITVENSYERKPQTKYQSIENLLEKTKGKLKFDLSALVRFHGYQLVWYKFPDVKTKDKVLKEELKNAKLMLQNGEIYKLGQLYKKIYDAENTNLESAFCLAMCYELIGNYPKADEYYAKKPDFHAKVRMKENMVLFDYLKSINAVLVLKEF